ncbi:hypothetical protein KIH87_04405 [Paraneptunicella aestuarii]|uniref:hypothetical protein n=1 Tax=Paraneptunicella aestuarii TaxID=2831148 RepID=UPI001E4B5F17|nr:hypothetical protein [Paraneptunicella aestuarii]UAA39607.1 hypothetical protein KIH87_04405 [Paraneptunicella aestuarii]
MKIWMRNSAIKFTIFYICVLVLMLSFINSFMDDDAERSMNAAKQDCVESDVKEEVESGHSEQKEKRFCNNLIR